MNAKDDSCTKSSIVEIDLNRWVAGMIRVRIGSRVFSKWYPQCVKLQEVVAEAFYDAQLQQDLSSGNVVFTSFTQERETEMVLELR